MSIIQRIIAVQILYFLTTNATAARCADEGEVCRCHGEVVYGNKYVSGKSGAMAQLEQALAAPHVKKWATGELVCDNDTFGADPARGFTKACHCNQNPEGAVLGKECGETKDCAGDLVCSSASLTCVDSYVMVFFSDIENHYRGFEDSHSYGFVKNLVNLKDKDLYFDGDFQGKLIDPRMLLHGGDLSRDRWATYWRPRVHKLDNAQATIDEEFENVWDQTYKAGIPTLSTYGNHDYSGDSVPEGAMVDVNGFPWKKIAENKRCSGEVVDLGLQHEIGSCSRECVRHGLRENLNVAYFGVSRKMDKVKRDHYPCKCYMGPAHTEEFGVKCAFEDLKDHDLFEVETWYERAAENKICDGEAKYRTYKPSLAGCAGYCLVRWRTPVFAYADKDAMNGDNPKCQGRGEGECQCVCFVESSHPGKCDKGEVKDELHHLYRITNYMKAPGAPTKESGANVGLDYDWSKDEQHHDNLMTQDFVRRTVEKSAKLGVHYQMVKPEGKFGPIHYVAEYMGVQVILFGTGPFEESYNKNGDDDYTGVPATEQLERLKQVVDYKKPTLMISHFPIHAWQSIHGSKKMEEFKEFVCDFEHVTYLDGHTHHQAKQVHSCPGWGKRFVEYTAPYRSGNKSGALAMLVSPQDGVLQVKFVHVNERVKGDKLACIPEGGRCLAGTTCRDCCLDSRGRKLEYNWWYSIVGHGCGLEPRYPDGKRCAAGTSCNNCENSYSWWHSMFGHACGKEPLWEDGTRCAAGTSCNQCKNGYTFWHKYFAHACGEDKVMWPRGTRCLAGTTCNQCKGGYYEWWETIFGHACGHEPCWKEGKLCGYGTTCKKCCKGHKECPWYRFGVCECA